MDRVRRRLYNGPSPRFAAPDERTKMNTPTPIRFALILSLACLSSAALARHHHHHPHPQAASAAASASQDAAQPDEASEQTLAKVTSTPFDYYVLALSWSPNYCLTHPEDKDQCNGKGYGFVLHGLWPQYLKGGYPHDCATPYKLDRPAIAYGVGVYPSTKLINHEWTKHGSCSGLSALDYFKLSDKALASIHIPLPMQAPTKTLMEPVTQITSGFAMANQGLSSKSVTVSCSGPELAEVRVCLSKSLQAVACGKDVRNSCRSGPIRIRSVR
jgi:ribonuclease T2